MLTLRPADISDLPPLATLLEEHRDKYFDDYSEFSPVFLRELIASGELIVIDRYGYPAGVCWYSNRLDDLHATISLLVNPQYLKECIREKAVSQVLDAGFAMGVGKIKAYPMASQKGAIKLLKQHRFRELDTLYKETKQNGIKMDIRPFELRRKHWESRDLT